MTRYSTDDFDTEGKLRNGFDYHLQVWVEDYIIQPCGHPEWMQECCNARELRGRDIRRYCED